MLYELRELHELHELDGPLRGSSLVGWPMTRRRPAGSRDIANGGAVQGTVMAACLLSRRFVCILFAFCSVILPCDLSAGARSVVSAPLVLARHPTR